MFKLMANVIELVKDINMRNELIAENGVTFDVRELTDAQIKALCV